MKIEQFRIPFTVKEMEIMMMYIENDPINSTDPMYRKLFNKLKGQHFKCAEGLKKPDYVNLNKPKMNNLSADDMGLEDEVAKFERENANWMAEMERESAKRGNPTVDKRTVDIIPDVYKRRDDPVDNDSEAASSFFSDIDKY